MEIRTRTALILLPFLFAGCAGDDAEEVVPSAPSTTVPGPTIDWDNVGTVDLGSGYSLRDEEGDAPIVAIYRGDEHIGIVEINRFPKDNETLEDHVEEFHASLEADRKDGCGSDYVYERFLERYRQGPDGQFVHYGFTGAKPGEEVSETTLQWAAFQGDELVIINVAAYDAGGCIGTEGAELTIDDLAEIRPLLQAAIERSPFPR